MDGKHSHPKNKLVHDSEGNEENGYPVPDSNKTKRDTHKESNESHNTLKEEDLQENTKNFMEMLPKYTGGIQEITRQQK
jgi:hypothetical protein